MSLQNSELISQAQSEQYAPVDDSLMRPLALMRRYDQAVEAGKFRRARSLAARAVHYAQLGNDFPMLGRTYLTELGFPFYQQQAAGERTAPLPESLTEELQASAGHVAERLDTILTIMDRVAGEHDRRTLKGAASELTVFLLHTQALNYDGSDAYSMIPSSISQDRSKTDLDDDIHQGIDFVATRHHDNTIIPVQVKTGANSRQYEDNILVITADHLVKGTDYSLRDLQNALLRNIFSDLSIQSDTDSQPYTAEERAAAFMNNTRLIQLASSRLFAALDTYEA